MNIYHSWYLVIYGHRGTSVETQDLAEHFFFFFLMPKSNNAHVTATELTFCVFLMWLSRRILEVNLGTVDIRECIFTASEAILNIFHLLASIHGG